MFNFAVVTWICLWHGYVIWWDLCQKYTAVGFFLLNLQKSCCVGRNQQQKQSIISLLITSTHGKLHMNDGSTMFQKKKQKSSSSCTPLLKDLMPTAVWKTKTCKLFLCSVQPVTGAAAAAQVSYTVFPAVSPNMNIAADSVSSEANIETLMRSLQDE